MADYARREPRAQVLYQAVEAHLDGFLAAAGPGGLPAHVQKEFEAYLGCGLLERGAVAFLCDGCGARVFVAMSCKRRGFCPTCLGRRMNEVAQHLSERVFPGVPVRKWVLSLPMAVRFLLLRRPALCGEVLAIFLRVVFAQLRRRAAQAGIPDGQAGSVSVLQRFGDGLRLNLHIHALLPDGVFVPSEEGGPMRFIPLGAPSKEELAHLAVRVRQRVTRLLARRGLLPEQLDEQLLGGDEGPLLSFQAAAAQGRIAMGPRAGWRVLRVGGLPVAMPPRGLCADAQGYNLHAGVHVPAGQRERLLSLCRYLLRPPLCQERLTRLDDGRMRVELKRPYLDCA